jgi:hypothetical protein
MLLFSLQSFLELVGGGSFNTPQESSVTVRVPLGEQGGNLSDVQVLLALSEDHCVFSENSRLACASPSLSAAPSQEQAAAHTLVGLYAGDMSSPAGAPGATAGPPKLKFHDIAGLPSALVHR